MKDLIPMLETDNLLQTEVFYTQKLGFKLNGKFPEEGVPTWISIQRGNACIMFSDRFMVTKEKKPLMTGSLYIYPDNIHQLWEEWKDEFTFEWPLQSFHYGMTEFAIRDNNNYLLIFGQESESVS